MLGLCPTLAVTSSAINAIGMGLSTTLVLIGSNTIISLISKTVPKEIRIPVFITIIASFVTIIQMLLAAFLPTINQALGIYIPLIVVNCIILGRAEAYASSNNALNSLLDGIEKGIGFTIALLLIGSIRELLGNGTIFGLTLLPGYTPMLTMILAPGAFFTMGILLAILNYFKGKA